MKCPYCVSEIDDEALACPHCARDLYLLKPLLAKIEGLEKEIGELRTKVLEAADAAARTPSQAGVSPSPPQPAGIAQATAAFAMLWLLPLGLLLAAHGIITLAYDLNTLYLRIVSLLVPLPFGLFLMGSRQRSFILWGLAAFAMALLAVLGMSGATHLVDGTPVLPADMREWKEFLEYAASVGLSYMTGMVVGRMLLQRREAAELGAQVQGLAQSLAKLLSDGKASAEKVHALAEKLNRIGTSLTATATTAASIYTGLRSFAGG